MGGTTAAPAPQGLAELGALLGGSIDIIGMIGSFMSLATSPLFAGMVGADIKGDMTTTLCKTFGNKDALSALISSFAGSPSGPNPGEECVKDNSGGSGPFKSKILEDASLPNHTIYVPATAPPEPLPVIAWANGFCLPAGTMFANFLAELASYGFMVIANGKIEHNGQLGATTRESELIKSIDWVTKSPEAKKHGNIDSKNIAIAGQSCGGLNAVCWR